jgi:hypothetical protein
MLGLLFFIAMFLVVAAVMAGLLFREIVSQDNSMNFSDFYVSYLGMYQVSTTRTVGIVDRETMTCY